MGFYRDRPLSFQAALKAARELLEASPELVEKGSIVAEAEQLVLAAYRGSAGRLLSRMELMSRLADRYPEDAGESLLILAASRAEGKPLQHLTGVQAFLDHEYEVGPDVLIPRPETEVLALTAIEELQEAFGSPALGLEVGLGSGVLSIELLSAFSTLTMIASELTEAAEARARSNAARILGAEGVSRRLRVVRPSGPLEVWPPLAAELAGRKADFLISNPPYLATDDPIEAEVSRYEPSTALFAPSLDALHFYREIARNVGPALAPGGRVFLEIAHPRAGETAEVFADAGWTPRILPDLTGRDRVLVATFSGSG